MLILQLAHMRELVLYHSVDCALDFMNDLGLDEVHITVLDQWLSSFVMLQEGLSRQNSFFRTNN